MFKIRLSKVGRHKLPIYRIVAIDSRIKRDGGYTHLLGTFNPMKKKYEFKEELILKLLSEGAQPSETILNILKKEGIWKKHLDNKITAKKPKKEKKVRKSKTKKEKKEKTKKDKKPA